MTDSNLQTVRRRADVPRDKAMLALVAKYPDFDVLSFVEEKVQRTAGTETEEFSEFVAKLQKKGFNPHEEGGEAGMPVGPAPEGPPSEEGGDDDGDVEIKVDKGDDEGEEHGESTGDKLDAILDLLTELAGPEEPAGDPAAMGPEGAMPPAPGADALPPPVKPHNEMQGTPAFASTKPSYTLEADAPGQKLADAVKEINAYVGQHGYRVAKINRKGPKLTAVISPVA